MFAAIPATATIVEARTGVRLDRAAMLAAICDRAENLVAAGAHRAAKIAIAHEHPIAVLIDLFACWRIGAVAVLLSPGMAAAERANVAARLQPAIWIGAPAPAGLPSLAPASAEPQSGGAFDVADAAGLDDPALVLMTSGTTAQPKGVIHTRRSLMARIALNLAHIPAADLVQSLTLLPMHFGHGLIGNCLTPLYAGATLVMEPNPGPSGLAALGKRIDAHAITFLSSVPSLWRVALKLSPPPEASTLRRVHVGSAPLAAGLWQQIIDWSGTSHVVNMYGITETANWIGGHDAAEAPPADGLVGKAWGGSIRVIGADGVFSTTGRGEVAVASPGSMSGYLDAPEANDAAFRGGWFLTADIGEFDDHGRLSIVGRLKHEINKGGIKIPAEEIDLLLERHLDVAEACAVALPDAIAGELVAAAVVRRADTLTTAALREWCRTVIRAEAVPDRIVFVDSLPRNERGKLDRRRALEMVLAGGAKIGA